MAFYRQNAAQIEPRNGTAPCRNAYPFSGTNYGPQMLPQSEENPGSTRSSFRAGPDWNNEQVTFGRHDGLRGRLMEVAQADMYGSFVQPWNRSGAWDQPGAGIAAAGLVRLAPSTSAHHGLAMATGAGPTMIFTAPPVFSVQSVPIYALGL